MWDIDNTLLTGGGVGGRAWRAAFAAVTGQPMTIMPSFGGRTDLDLVTETLASHGVTDCTPERFFARYCEEVDGTRHLFAEQGSLLPGVRAVLDELGARDDVVQTLVTGNVPRVAAAKIAAFGLGDDFDIEVAAYGTDHTVRAKLVGNSLRRAEAKYGERFQPVVVGDTARDVEGALANDAVAIGVATGGTSAGDLRRAGAHVVLDDLSDVAATVTAITTALSR